MTYFKPYHFSPYFKAWKHIIQFKSTERKTKALIFSNGKILPFDSGNPNLEYTKQDPATYDLIFHAEVEPSVFCQYDNLKTMNGMGLLLVNKKIITILQEICPDDFQVFPATIISDKPKKFQFENHDYFVVNLTKTVDVVDEENSTFTCYENGNLDKIYKLTYIKNGMGNAHIARQYNYRGEILVSPELAKRFKKEKVTGVKFKTDEEAYPYVPKTEYLLTLYNNNEFSEAKRSFVMALCNRSSVNEILINIKQTQNHLLIDLNIILHELVKLVLSSSALHKKECEELLQCLDERMKNQQ